MTFPDEKLQIKVADTFKVLCDPTRLKIVMVLQQGELCVNDIAAATGQLQTSVSYHLKTLRQLNLVNVRRNGKQTFYSLADYHVSILLQVAIEHAGELQK